jgi:uncharacterized phage protein (TIGR01671 family)
MNEINHKHVERSATPKYREIKFRGFTNNELTNKWVEGYYSFHSGYDRITRFEDGRMKEYSVDRDSVGEFTGLHDRDGKEIYEGDLFDCIYLFDGCDGHRFEVVYNNDTTDFRLKRIGGECQQKSVFQSIRDVARYGIIGNIYEQPTADTAQAAEGE